MSLRENYSVVASTLALVVALGTGGAYAAGKIGAKDIKKNAVAGKAVKDGSLTGKDVKDGSLSGADVLDGSVSLADLASGVLPAAAQGGVGGPGDVNFPMPEGNVLGSEIAFEFTKPTKVLAIINAKGSVTCSAAGGCASEWAVYGKQGTTIVPFNGSLIGAYSSANLTKAIDRTRVGVATLGPGKWTVGFGSKLSGNWAGGSNDAIEVAAFTVGN